MQTSCYRLPGFYVLLVSVLVIQAGKINVEGILLDLLCVEQVIIFMSVLDCG